ncbi:Cystathionine beta-lyase/cystathionine gamma-synthase family protein [Tenacibaculum maritimum]|uniref:PLP-dependent transferase n=1 Tax=Tenacibaculum maritimum TaxID=107401 RepID=UPI0012E55E60|nr:PLP-dependent transferase [Tenacibaculum maritimum]CAA0188712.1 Cystathionine beta-lyase/cystathionine gamma-synthase family protein [Tenacibaculum maritimum]
MQKNKILKHIKLVLKNMPAGWLTTTTHRLDIYNESLAKTEFLEQFEKLFIANDSDMVALNELPTAYDYIRLGHPLSCVLEWTFAKLHGISPKNIISFDSKIIPILAILRKNLLAHKNTQILYTEELPNYFDIEVIKRIYGYNFELKKIKNTKEVPHFEGSTILITKASKINAIDLSPEIDFFIHLYENLGSILIIKENNNQSYISDIQHVRRRETVAMTPANCLKALEILIENTFLQETIKKQDNAHKKSVLKSIQDITGTASKPLVASSGLSIQYAILMGLVHDALENHKGKNIEIIVPPNCYGGTNDQARRIAACIHNVTIVDLPVDGDHDMVQSIEIVLDQAANKNTIPYIIAEIPTNPRVEVPNLTTLRNTLSKKRETPNGDTAVPPVFILDQTFCPNVRFLETNGILSSIKTISFASGSKFPSGGKCTAGYCVSNKIGLSLMEKIGFHLRLCDNEATPFQYKILAEQLPSMNQRITQAYLNTRDFVNFIQKELPKAKINFVSEALAQQGFTPSVFSLDLPTRGNTDEERETHKRMLNHQLINLMISEIPNESKYCVSYGQLKGCYWTIPATSTQGTTKEGDKDYIARVALSPNMNLGRHKEVFLKFIQTYL